MSPKNHWQCNTTPFMVKTHQANFEALSSSLWRQEIRYGTSKIDLMYFEYMYVQDPDGNTCTRIH